MEKIVHTITNEDGSIDVYETDGINPPTKNGKPIVNYMPPKKVQPYPRANKIVWSKPIKNKQ